MLAILCLLDLWLSSEHNVLEWPLADENLAFLKRYCFFVHMVKCLEKTRVLVQGTYLHYVGVIAVLMAGLSCFANL